MNFRRQHNRLNTENEMPLDTYRSVVKSLYTDKIALLIGAFSTLIAATILYVRTGDMVHLAFAIALSLVSVIRIQDIRHFDRKWEKTRRYRDLLVSWEHRYLVLGSTYSGFLGLWCFSTSARSDDDFALLMTISITLANFIGITGRNFGSEKVVTYQLMWAAIPLILGSFIFGDVYHILLGAFLIPFIIGIKYMAQRLRNILLSATTTAYENQVIAGRFDAALNNISHGIAMIDDQQKFVVVNDNFSDLIGAGNRELIDLTLENIDQILVENNPKGARHEMLVDIVRCLDNGQSRRASYVLSDKRVIELNFYPRNDGGVILLEDISLRVASEEEIKILAKYDPLTHLPNRRFFMEEVDRLLTKDGLLEPCSLYFVDLDKFKEINDSLGHTTGDKLLNTISVRLKSVMGSGSIICRFGGDEFVIIVPGLTNRKQSDSFAQQVIDIVSKPLLLDGNQIIVGATVGISICPDDARDPDFLLKYSDAALYQAKTSGRGMFAYYSEELGQSIKDRRQLELDLRNAIEKKQLQINYQPLVNLAENKINTCEALLRWHHPTRGWVRPDIFIPIAEETGFITQLGEFVLENAALQCLEWPENINVAVNVSSVQFQRSDMDKVIHKILKKTGLKAHRLEIEVTESAMLDDVNGVKKVLNNLSKLGVRISLDDFGTGFSSLSYLHSLPLDKVKIDRSFIANIQTDRKSIVLLEGISNLSRSLGLRIVVEGVETVSQLELLQERIHVDEVQGFLFGKALPAENLTKLLKGGESLYASNRELKKAASA